MILALINTKKSKFCQNAEFILLHFACKETSRIRDNPLINKLLAKTLVATANLTFLLKYLEDKYHRSNFVVIEKQRKALKKTKQRQYEKEYYYNYAVNKFNLH